MKSTAIFVGSLVAASQFFGALAHTPNRMAVGASHKAIREEKAVQKPIKTPVPGSITSQGCFSSTGNLTDAKLVPSTVSSGSCVEACKKKNSDVMGIMGQKCYCGDTYPEKDALGKDSSCNYPCPAYPYEVCGGIDDPGYISIFNLGEEVSVPYYEPPKEDEDDDDDEEPASSSAAGPSSTASAAPEESAAESQVPPEEEKSKDEGPNIAGVVGGSVAGVVAIAGVALGMWFFMRRRRNSEIEEEHRRNAAVNAFISGSKPPGSSGSISMTDSRLEPGLAHRRLSDGSIADNEDYSRKILRVTNA